MAFAGLGGDGGVVFFWAAYLEDSSLLSKSLQSCCAAPVLVLWIGEQTLVGAVFLFVCFLTFAYQPFQMGAMRQKENPGNSSLWCPWVAKSLVSQPSLYFSVSFCF